MNKKGGVLKKLCFGKGVTRQLGFINCVEKVNWKTYRVSKTDVSSVSPSSFAQTFDIGHLISQLKKLTTVAKSRY